MTLLKSTIQAGRKDPTKGSSSNADVDAIFKKAMELGAVEGPTDQQRPTTTSTRFTRTPRLLSGDTAPSPSPSPQQPEPVFHNIVFWSNGFTVDNGPLRRLDDPENAVFLESIRKSECPKELDAPNRRSPVHVNLIKREENFPEPEKPRHVPFQGLGRALGSSSIPQTAEATVNSTAFNTAPAHSMGLVVDQTLPSASIQLRFADGTRMVAYFNYHHTVNDIRAFINASWSSSPHNYQLQQMGFPPKVLADLTQTIEQMGLANSVVIQKF